MINAVTRNVLLGGFCAGLADFIYPSVKTVIKGGSWMQPWRGVASGWLGSVPREAGFEVTLLGIASHFFICMSGAALLYLLAKHVKLLPRQWVALGVLYGIAVLATMNYIILPLSAIGRGIYPLETIYIPMFWHIVLVGLPTAFFVSRALQVSSDAR